VNAPSRHGELDAFLGVIARALAPVLAPEIAKLLRGEQDGMIDQSASPLGRRRHCAAVRRRRARGEPGAAVIGRRYLLSADALRAELERASGQPKAAPAGAGGVRGELERELSALRVVR
jgi:hypothetical protein